MADEEAFAGLRVKNHLGVMVRLLVVEQDERHGAESGILEKGGGDIVAGRMFPGSFDQFGVGHARE